MKKNKTKQLTEAQLKKTLWNLCKQIIRQRYGNTCYTCNAKKLKGSNWQTGHFLPSKMCGNYLRYDLRNLRPQCMYCNIHLGGNGAVFYRNMVKEEGQKYVDNLFADLKKKQTLSRKWLNGKITEYIDKLK